ncbi:beta-propeller fold lactonase family protein [bacterium]|nr:beta-propeller fold lactonase family protein [bacterium]
MQKNFLICLVILLTFSCTSFAEMLIVLNKAEATASLIDLKTGRVAATVPTGNGPHEAAVTKDWKFAIATNYGTRESPGNSLTLIDITAGKAVKTIDLGDYKRPHGIQWMPDGKRVLVTSEESKALLLVNLENGIVEKKYITGQETSHMVRLAPDAKRAYVANIGSGSVTVIDLNKNEVIRTIPTGNGAEGIDITPDARWVWVTNREADIVSVIDTISLEVSKTLESKSFPIRAKVTPDGKRVFVTNAKSGDLTVFDAAEKKEIQKIQIPLQAVDTQGRLFGDQFGSSSVPVGILIHPDGKRAYIAHAHADVITILDLESGKPSGTLKAGKEPDGMAYTSVSIALE